MTSRLPHQRHRVSTSYARADIFPHEPSPIVRDVRPSSYDEFQPQPHDRLDTYQDRKKKPTSPEWTQKRTSIKFDDGFSSIKISSSYTYAAATMPSQDMPRRSTSTRHNIGGPPLSYTKEGRRDTGRRSSRPRDRDYVPKYQERNPSPLRRRPTFTDEKRADKGYTYATDTRPITPERPRNDYPSTSWHRRDSGRGPYPENSGYTVKPEIKPDPRFIYEYREAQPKPTSTDHGRGYDDPRSKPRYAFEPDPRYRYEYREAKPKPTSTNHDRGYRNHGSKSRYDQSSRPHGRSEFREPPPSVQAPLPDYYALLGISSRASSKEIGQAARKKRMAVHPDKLKRSGMSTNQLRSIDEIAASVGQAADVLMDPKQKKDYDEQRARREL